MLVSGGEVTRAWRGQTGGRVARATAGRASRAAAAPRGPSETHLQGLNAAQPATERAELTRQAQVTKETGRLETPSRRRAPGSTVERPTRRGREARASGSGRVGTAHACRRRGKARTVEGRSGRTGGGATWSRQRRELGPRPPAVAEGDPTAARAEPARACPVAARCVPRREKAPLCRAEGPRAARCPHVPDGTPEGGPGSRMARRQGVRPRGHRRPPSCTPRGCARPTISVAGLEQTQLRWGARPPSSPAAGANRDETFAWSLAGVWEPSPGPLDSPAVRCLSHANATPGAAAARPRDGGRVPGSWGAERRRELQPQRGQAVALQPPHACAGASPGEGGEQVGAVSGRGPSTWGRASRGVGVARRAGGPFLSTLFLSWSLTAATARPPAFAWSPSYHRGPLRDPGAGSPRRWTLD